MTEQNAKTFLGFSKEQWKEYACPILLATAVNFASFYTFSKPSAFVLTALFVAECVYLFKLFAKLRERKSGGFVYTLMLGAAALVSLVLVLIHSAGYGRYSPIRWFYAQDTEGFQPLLIAALYTVGAFFLISIIYYFTAIRYRTMGIMLCTMFPFFFFAKRSDIMPDILITLIMLLFLAVIIHNKRLKTPEKDGKKSLLQIDRAYIICIAVFTLITGAITMAAEKPNYQAFLEKNARLVNPFGLGLGGSSGYEELSDRSSARDAAPSYNYEPLFYFETDSKQSVIYLRTTAYDYFNSDVWEIRDEGRSVFYSLSLSEYGTDDVADDFSSLTSGKNDTLYTLQKGKVFDEQFTPSYLPAPLGTVTDDRAARGLKYYKSSSDTSILRDTVYYFLTPLDDSFEFIEPQQSLYKIAKEYNYSSDEYIAFLESHASGSAGNRLLEDYLRARNSYTDQSNISPKLQKLALEITANCHSDLEKAKKLESYFTENGFKYSLNYKPKDNSVDYFVFESKTGYCAGYATAMTLMARAAGLPARYVEGFAAFEKNENGQFVIRDGYAHAFVEVYIPGAGWTAFDPTVSDYRTVRDSAELNGLGVLSKVFGALNRMSVVFAVALIVLLFALSDIIKEYFLRTLIHFMDTDERIFLLYENILRTVGNSVNEDFGSYTPNMIRAYLSENRGAVPEKLIDLFERTAFGGYRCGAEEYNEAYKEYKRCYKYLRRPKRKTEKSIV